MDPAQVDIVLVRPSRPHNVAAACRAMRNMGLRRLWIVEPPAGLERPEVRALAYGAWDVLDGARTAGTLRAAVAEAHLVVGTSSRAAPGCWTPRRLAAEAGQRAGGGRVAVVFGPEATGLRTDELEICPVRVSIPADPAHPSLNLAQAVLIVAYEIWAGAAPEASPPPPGRATAREMEAALDAWSDALLAIGYLNPARPGAILAELRRLLARAGTTSRELLLLRGMARQIRWAGAAARGGPAAAAALARGAAAARPRPQRSGDSRREQP